MKTNAVNLFLKRALPGAALLLSLAGFPSLAQDKIDFLMNRFDASRTGANLLETSLTASNVNSATFGKLWSYNVSGQVYAQPLYVTGVTIPGLGKKNVVYIADMHNNIYAYDADDQSKASTPYWQVSYGNSVPLPNANIAEHDYNDIHIEIGIMGTPCIDKSTNTIYFVSKHQVGSVYSDSLHALDLSTGLPKFGGSKLIAATIAGTGDGGTTISFVSNKSNQRCALLLSNGIVYIAYASYADIGPYHGWIFGYNAGNISQRIITGCLNPNGAFDGIWMAGAGPSVDASGNLYVVSGTGQTGVRDQGESFIKLVPNVAQGTLPITDSFTPYNYDSLNRTDGETGSGGAMIIPGTHLILNAGKAGIMYLVDGDNMGGYHAGTDPSADQILQEVKLFPGQVMGTPVIWGDSSANSNTALTYWWAQNDVLKAFRFDYLAKQINTTPFAKGSRTEMPELPGGIMALSANGHQAGSGILWVNYPLGNANINTVSGVLRAFNANTLTEIWNSAEVPNRDSLGSFAKFVSPTVVNGKVYMATFSGTVNVYGFLSVLPVVYQDFRASRQNSAVRLQWTTSNENNNDHFDVLRSTDGSHFGVIGTVAGRGNSNITQDYSFTDASPVDGTNYYQLRQVDFDGKADYSRIVSIAMDLTTNIYFQVYPNPAHDHVTIGCNGLKTGDRIELQLFNSGGSLIYSRSVILSGDNKISIDRSRSMYTGMYFIRLILPSGEIREERLIWGS